MPIVSFFAGGGADYVRHEQVLMTGRDGIIEHREAPLVEVFAREYEVELLSGLPDAYRANRFDFPPDTGYDGQLLRVVSHSGEDFVAAITGAAADLKLITWYDPNVFLAMPAGWLIDAARPKSSVDFAPLEEIFAGHSIHYAVGLPGEGAILLGHCCGICCYDRTGFRWRREDLFCCKDPVIAIVGSELWLTAEACVVDSGPTLKRVSLASGRSIGV